MELDKNLDKTNDEAITWEEHINDKIKENLKNAIKHRNNDDLEEIEIQDMASIDSIEDGIVSCELLDKSMIEIPISNFRYDIEEGDIINLKLKYKERKNYRYRNFR